MMHVLGRVARIMGALIAVLLFLLCSAVWLINFLNWDRHKEQLSRAIAALTPYRVEALEGVRLRLTSSAGIDVKGISLLATEKDVPLRVFASGPFRLRVAVWPLLKGQLLIEQLSMENGDLRWQKVADSREAAPEEKGDGKLPQIFLALLSVKASEFRYDGPSPEDTMRLSVDEVLVTSPGKKLRTYLYASGQLNKLPLDIQGQTPSLVDLMAADRDLPFWADARLGHNILALEGNYAKTPGKLGLEAKLKGPDLEEIKQLLRLNMGRVPAYSLALKLEIEMREQMLAAEKIEMKVGQSSLAGKASFDWSAERPLAKGKLIAPLIVQSDLAGLFKSDPRYKEAEKVPKPEGQYFSDKRIEVAPLKAVDLDVCLEVRKFSGEKSGLAVDGGKACVRLDRGDLTVKPLSFSVAAGAVAGSLRFDARRYPLDVSIDLSAKRVNLSDLLGPLATEIPVIKLRPKDMARGFITGNLNLKMKGESPYQFVKDMKGPIGIVIEDGALSATVIEGFGIDVSQTLLSWFKKNPLYKMDCTLASFEAEDGKIVTKAFLVSTTDSSIKGDGTIDLSGNRVDYRFSVHPHDFSIGSIRSPILIRGPINDFKVALEKKELLTRAGVAAALGALVNPLLALLPLTETGLDKSGSCKSVVGEMQKVAARAQATEKREASKE